MRCDGCGCAVSWASATVRDPGQLYVFYDGRLKVVGIAVRSGKGYGVFCAAEPCARGVS